MGREERKVEKARLRTAHAFTDEEVPAKTFGSTGYDPTRNSNFMSQPAFDYWKSRHPKTAAGLSFASRDIDGDEVPEAVVSSGDGSIFAVNGWQLKPSRAQYTQPTWRQQGAARVAHRQEYYDEDLKSIYKQFGKMVVKDAFAELVKEIGPIKATRKDGSQIMNSKGEPTYRGYSHYSKNVAKLLVGNELDKRLLDAYADSINQYPQFAGWNAHGVVDLAVKDSPAAKAAAFLRRSKEYKQQLKRGLGAVIEHPNKSAVIMAIKGLIGVDQGTIRREAVQLAEMDDIPALAQTAESGGQ
jgi:hypothetical protein